MAAEPNAAPGDHPPGAAFVRPGGGPAEPPREFVERMTRLLGDEIGAFLEALASPASGLRVNTLRVEPERFEEMAPFTLSRLAFPAEGFRVGEGERPGRHPYHAAGVYYLQDPGAMAVGVLMGARPGEKVLDLAAAPGGKATHIAAMMQGEGVLVANDVHPTRARELAGNLERLGVTNALITCDTPDRLAAQLGPQFDRVLLDAPCSGESMFHKSEAARVDWSPGAVAGCARRQEDLLDQAGGLVRPGGLLLYSTCTFSAAENEGVATAFLASHPDFEIADLPDVPGASPGRADWLDPEAASAAAERTLRLWPHRVPGAGHFVAAFRRVAGPEARARPSSPARAPAASVEMAGAFLREYLPRLPVSLASPTAVRDELFAPPIGAPATEGLRVIRRGLWLGSVRKGRFEPSHSLAMASPAAAAAEPLLLPAEDPRVSAYLRGETLTAAGAPGWVLVTVDGFPLGWGKRVGDVVKNHYPKGLRRR